MASWAFADLMRRPGHLCPSHCAPSTLVLYPGKSGCASAGGGAPACMLYLPEATERLCAAFPLAACPPSSRHSDEESGRMVAVAVQVKSCWSSSAHLRSGAVGMAESGGESGSVKLVLADGEENTARCPELTRWAEKLSIPPFVSPLRVSRWPGRSGVVWMMGSAGAGAIAGAAGLLQ